MNEFYDKVGLEPAKPRVYFCGRCDMMATENQDIAIPVQCFFSPDCELHLLTCECHIPADFAPGNYLLCNGKRDGCCYSEAQD